MDSKEGDSHDRNQEESSPHHTHNTSPSELLSSDKSKAADAADDLLNAASECCIQIEKVETYLLQYTSGNPSPPTTATAPPSEKKDDSVDAEESVGRAFKMAIDSEIVSKTC